MSITNQLVELTHEELQLMVQNLDSKDVVSNPLERFIMYSSIIAARGRQHNQYQIHSGSKPSIFLSLQSSC